MRHTETWNHLGWKRPSRSQSSNINITFPIPPPNHVPNHHVYKSIYLQLLSTQKVS